MPLPVQIDISIKPVNQILNADCDHPLPRAALSRPGQSWISNRVVASTAQEAILDVDPR